MRRQQAEIPLLPLAEEFHADLWDFRAPRNVWFALFSFDYEIRMLEIFI